MSVEVIGAGWSRTGTSSFKQALEILGYTPYHMYENMRLGHCDKWIQAFDEKDTKVSMIPHVYQSAPKRKKVKFRKFPVNQVEERNTA